LALLVDLKKGKRGTIAKAISIVENDPKEARKLLKKIFKDSGNSIIIGITGPAGSGKSSLINKTVIAMKKLGTKPAVLAIDPTSHITGGAILGDRVRMTESTDSGTYIRSIASRGATGAISNSLRNSVRILEYAGLDITVVVFNPNTGDSIQTIKAGLTEIGDIYLVNKSDLSGANQLFDAVLDYIGSTERNPIILKTSVKKNTGITVFAKTLKDMMKSKKKSKKDRNQEQLEAELKDIVLNNFEEKIDGMLDSDKIFSKYLKKLQSKSIDPFEAGDKITKSLLK
jgi:LAO/AO transport system kinase